MKKETAKDIATTLIAISGYNFDLSAFDDSMDLINDKDRDKILDELKLICAKMIGKIEDKRSIKLNVGSTRDAISIILYEYDSDPLVRTQH